MPWRTSTINGNDFFLYIRCSHSKQHNQLSAFSVAPPPSKVFTVASSTNSMVASPWISMSTVYKPCTVFLAYQCLLVQIRRHFPVNGKNSVHLFNGVSWLEESEKLAVTEDWTQALRTKLSALSTELQPLLQSSNVARCPMLHSVTVQ